MSEIIEEIKAQEVSQEIVRTLTGLKVCSDMMKELEGLRKFKEYFDELYGTGLEILNWHLNGETESFDKFYEDACGDLAV